MSNLRADRYTARIEPASPRTDFDLVLNDTEDILFRLAQSVENKDRYTASHCERLAFLSVTIGMAMGLDRESLMTLYRGGYLHDVGEVGIPDSILLKPGKLSSADWTIMKAHPARGEEICRQFPSLDPVLPIVRHHHERWDGSGYPDGLAGERIPLLARVVQLADIYDALVSPRPYKAGLMAEEALAIIQSETELGWRDPALVKIFHRLHEEVIAPLIPSLGVADGKVGAIQAALVRL